MSEKSSNDSGLESAPEHVQLAVDLIMLLETNNINAQTALSAINIVKSDLEQKLATASP